MLKINIPKNVIKEDNLPIPEKSKEHKTNISNPLEDIGKSTLLNQLKTLEEGILEIERKYDKETIYYKYLQEKSFRMSLKVKNSSSLNTDIRNDNLLYEIIKTSTSANDKINCKENTTPWNKNNDNSKSELNEKITILTNESDSSENEFRDGCTNQFFFNNNNDELMILSNTVLKFPFKNILKLEVKNRRSNRVFLDFPADYVGVFLDIIRNYYYVNSLNEINNSQKKRIQILVPKGINKDSLMHGICSFFLFDNEGIPKSYLSLLQQENGVNSNSNQRKDFFSEYEFIYEQ